MAANLSGGSGKKAGDTSPRIGKPLEVARRGKTGARGRGADAIAARGHAIPSRPAVPSFSAAATARPRRDRDRLQGDRRAQRQRRRAQDALARRRLAGRPARRGEAAPAARSRRRGLARASGHRRDPRGRRTRGPGLPGDGIRRGRQSRHARNRGAHAAAAAGLRDVRAGRRRALLRAPARRHPPRHQARQHRLRPEEPPRAGHGFRRGAAREQPGDAHGRDPGLARPTWRPSSSTRGRSRRSRTSSRSASRCSSC